MENLNERENLIFIKLLQERSKTEYDEVEKNVLLKFYLRMSGSIYEEFCKFSHSEHLPPVEVLESWLEFPEITLNSINEVVWTALQQFAETLNENDKLCTISVDQTSTNLPKGINVYYLLGITIPWKFFLGVIVTESNVTARILFEQVRVIYFKLRLEIGLRPRILCLDAHSPHCKLLDDHFCGRHSCSCIVLKEHEHDLDKRYEHHLPVIFDPNHMGYNILDHFLKGHFDISPNAIGRCGFEINMTEPNSIAFINGNPLQTFLSFFDTENIQYTDARLQREGRVTDQERKSVISLMELINAVATPLLSDSIDDISRKQRRKLIEGLEAKMLEIQSKDAFRGSFVYLRNSNLLAGYMLNVKHLNEEYRHIKYTLISQEPIELLVHKIAEICNRRDGQTTVSNTEALAKQLIGMFTLFGFDVGLLLESYSTNITAGFVRRTPERDVKATPSYVLYDIPLIAIVMRREMQYASLEILSYPFDKYTWILLIISTISLIALCIQSRKFANSYSWYHVLEVLLGVPSYRVPKRISYALTFVIWILSTLVLRSVYQSLIFHLYRTHFYRGEHQSLAELAASNYKAVCTQRSEELLQYIPEFLDNSLPLTVLNTSDEMEPLRFMEKRADENIVALSVIDIIFYYLHTDKERARNTLVMLPFFVKSQQIVFYFTKHSYLAERFNEHILVLHQTGFLDYWRRISLESNRVTKIKGDTKNYGTELMVNIKQFYAILIIVSILYAVAIIFALEMVSKRLMLLQQFFNAV